MSIPTVWFWSILTHLRSTGEQALVRNWIVHSSTAYSTAPGCTAHKPPRDRRGVRPIFLAPGITLSLTDPDCPSTLRHARRRDRDRHGEIHATERKPTIQHTRHPLRATSELFQSYRRRHQPSLAVSIPLLQLCALRSAVCNSALVCTALELSEAGCESRTSTTTVARRASPRLCPIIRPDYVINMYRAQAGSNTHKRNLASPISPVQTTPNSLKTVRVAGCPRIPSESIRVFSQHHPPSSLYPSAYHRRRDAGDRKARPITARAANRAGKLLTPRLVTTFTSIREARPTVRVACSRVDPVISIPRIFDTQKLLA